MQWGLREIGKKAAQTLATSWRSMVVTDLAYKLIGFALLTPGAVLFLNWMISRRGTEVVADTEIARFFLTTPAGIIALLFGSAVVIAITAVESACLMAIGLAATRGIRLTARSALLFGAKHAGATLRLTVRMVLRILAGLLPFAAGIGAIYFGLLHDHDINYYLARKPAGFWFAVVLVTPIVCALVFLLLRTVARWALSLPLILFEHVSPSHALHESASRSAGNYRFVLIVLAVWALLALGIGAAVTALFEMSGRAVGPSLAGSMITLVLFISLLAFLWAISGLAVAIFNISLFSVLIVLLYLKTGGASNLNNSMLENAEQNKAFRASPGMVAGGSFILLLAAIGLGALVFFGSRHTHPVLTIAHRGASANAPENTLAAFRLAGSERADFVELDVQETRDGVVVVNHDSDLMKVGGSPMKIWEHTQLELHTIDIGSYFAAQFNTERLPTLKEALATCRGTTRVLVELKSYGHNQHLEERVAAIVEEAGMTKDCMYMSLDHSMVRTMKQIRPSWRVGVLAAKAIGDITTLGADFVAVEARMATRRFVRHAHRANQDVYVWTVDDPAWMLTAMGNGVDGLITNKPALAREIIKRRSEMSQAQRILVGLLVRLGASTGSLESEDALRP